MEKKKINNTEEREKIINPTPEIIDKIEEDRLGVEDVIIAIIAMYIAYQLGVAFNFLLHY